jgi:hypothetical protein
MGWSELGTSFHTMVLDGGGRRRYFTANIGKRLGISTNPGGTGTAAGNGRGGQVRNREGCADDAPPHGIWIPFSTSNPQSKQRQVTAGGQVPTW